MHDWVFFILSRIIGSILIMVGLHFVLWGKSQEKASNQEMEKDLRRHLLEDENKNKYVAVVADIPWE